MLVGALADPSTLLPIFAPVPLSGLRSRSRKNRIVAAPSRSLYIADSVTIWPLVITFPVAIVGANAFAHCVPLCPADVRDALPPNATATPSDGREPAPSRLNRYPVLSRAGLSLVVPYHESRIGNPPAFVSFGSIVPS